MIKDIYYEETGNHNDCAYFVGNDFVIKFTANVGKLKNHIQLSKAIENVGLCSSIAIKTVDGKEYIQDGKLYFYLTKYLGGNRIRLGGFYEGDYIMKSRFIGEINGQLHLALVKTDILVNDVNIYENVKN